MFGFLFKIARYSTKKSYYPRGRRRYSKPKIDHLGEKQSYYSEAGTDTAFSNNELAENIDHLSSAQVRKVIDGDTVIVRRDGSLIKIRLDAIDCPEDGQEWGDNATYGLIKIIGGKPIKLEEHGVDNHGRLLATIYAQEDGSGAWINVNEKMVVKGHAWVMRLFYKHLPQDRKDKLNSLERWAKSKKVGLWRSPNPIPPWKWRSD